MEANRRFSGFLHQNPRMHVTEGKSQVVPQNYFPFLKKKEKQKECLGRTCERSSPVLCDRTGSILQGILFSYPDSSPPPPSPLGIVVLCGHQGWLQEQGGSGENFQGALHPHRSPPILLLNRGLPHSCRGQEAGKGLTFLQTPHQPPPLAANVWS